MRILHVTECYGGGVRAVIEQLQAALSEHNHALVYAGAGAGAAPEGASWALASQPLARASQIARLADHWGADLIHAHSSWAGVYCRVARMPAPVIYQPHCFAFEDVFRSPWQRRFFWHTERLLAGRAAATLAVSPRERWLARSLCPATPCHLVPNASAVLWLSRPARPGRVRIAMSGRASRQKDPTLFARLAAVLRYRHPDWEFVWLGDGEPAFVRALEDSGVAISGWLGPVRLADELARTSCYVHTAAYEGFPVSILDAAQLGVPVIARAAPYLAGTGLTCFQGLRDGVELVERVVGEGSARQMLQSQGETVLRRMNPHNQAEACRRVYETYEVRM